MPGSLVPIPFYCLGGLATGQARVSMDKVMWAYQACQLRIW